MRRRITVFLLSLVFLAGCLITLLPVINELLYREKMKTTVSEFQSNTEHQQPPVVILPSGDGEPTEYTPVIHPELWKDIQLTLRADTQKHAYILRLNPQEGDYNLYCYCYRKDWLDRHLKNAEKGIRFIDPNYKELFRIEDGDKVRYSTRSGETRQMTCRYIDDYHFEANSYRGNNLYHICEFAELYQNHGCHGIIPLRQSLPESCFSTLETTGELIVITKGEKGYTPTDVFPQNTSPTEGAAALNAANGVTKAQEAAMVAGSMFGWDTPAANPKNYDALGQPIKNQRRSHAAER